MQCVLFIFSMMPLRLPSPRHTLLVEIKTPHPYELFLRPIATAASGVFPTMQVDRPLRRTRSCLPRQRDLNQVHGIHPFAPPPLSEG